MNGSSAFKWGAVLELINFKISGDEGVPVGRIFFVIVGGDFSNNAIGGSFSAVNGGSFGDVVVDVIFFA